MDLICEYNYDSFDPPIPMSLNCHLPTELFSITALGFLIVIFFVMIFLTLKVLKK